jgi:hypothetical protein
MAKDLKWKEWKIGNSFFRDRKNILIIGLVASLAIIVPILSVHSYNLYQQNQDLAIIFPQQENAWHDETCCHYLGVWEWIDFLNETEKHILKIFIDETNNTKPNLPADENQTYCIGKSWKWDNISMEEWEWTPNGTLRFPTNDTIVFDYEQFLIPLAYKNYAMMESMLSRHYRRGWTEHSVNVQLLNESVSHRQTIVTMAREVSDESLFYSGENVLEDSYLGIVYDYEMWGNDTLFNSPFHIDAQYVVEASTGIPLIQNIVFEMFSFFGIPGWDLWFTFSFRTIATTTALPTFSL